MFIAVNVTQPTFYIYVSEEGRRLAKDNGINHHQNANVDIEDDDENENKPKPNYNRKKNQRNNDMKKTM